MCARCLHNLFRVLCWMCADNHLTGPDGPPTEGQPMKTARDAHERPHKARLEAIVELIARDEALCSRLAAIGELLYSRHAQPTQVIHHAVA